MIGKVQNLVSLQMQNQLVNMSAVQKQEFAMKVKKQSGYYMLNVYKALEQKKYSLAKNILVYIADSCSCIENPDREVEELIEICCQQLAQIQKIEDYKQEYRINNLASSKNGNGKRKIDLYVMRYDKFSGEFQCDENKNKQISPDVLFYMSKINSILFNEQGNQNVHSMLAMFKLFWIQITITLALIAILTLIQFSGVSEHIFGDHQILQKIPLMIVTGLFIVPIVIIHLKKPAQKDTNFFEIILGEQIKKINKICRDKKQKIMFMMPEGLEINVKVEYQQTSQVFIDLTRIKKRLTYYEKSQAKI